MRLYLFLHKTGFLLFSMIIVPPINFLTDVNFLIFKKCLWREKLTRFLLKNILKYISIPLQFFIYYFLLLSATVPLTRAFKLYWFPCYRVKLFLPAVPLTRILKLYSIFYFVRCWQPNYVHVYTISTLVAEIGSTLYVNHVYVLFATSARST